MNKSSSKTKIHLICGFIGSGKTTFAKKLEKETGAIRFTKDEWLIHLFGRDPRQIDNFEKYDEKICELSNALAFRCAQAGLDVIIDDGFWFRAQRIETIEKIRSLGAEPLLYFVDTPMEEMKRRTLERNSTSDSSSFRIDAEMFDSYAKMFEPPSEDENPIVIDSNSPDVE